MNPFDHLIPETIYPEKRFNKRMLWATECSRRKETASGQ